MRIVKVTRVAKTSEIEAATAPDPCTRCRTHAGPPSTAGRPLRYEYEGQRLCADCFWDTRHPAPNPFEVQARRRVQKNLTLLATRDDKGEDDPADLMIGREWRTFGGAELTEAIIERFDRKTPSDLWSLMSDAITVYDPRDHKSHHKAPAGPPPQAESRRAGCRA